MHHHYRQVKKTLTLSVNLLVSSLACVIDLRGGADNKTGTMKESYITIDEINYYVEYREHKSWEELEGRGRWLVSFELVSIQVECDSIDPYGYLFKTDFLNITNQIGRAHV